ncbi:MAG: hypothetical protein RLZZ330_360 [Actinomycetota bacterium]|jgi:RNA polymerase sigma-70 factor (ECF subfamily)
MISEEGFEDWYRATWPTAYRAIRAVTLHHSDSEEVLSEAFTRAFEKVAELANHPAPEAWVIVTAMNIYRDRFKKLNNIKRFFFVQNDSYEMEPSSLSDDLEKALRLLPTRQREVIALRVILEYSSEETANFLGISVPTVSTHLRRGLESLRNGLDGDQS